MYIIISYVALQFLILFFVDLARNKKPELSKREADYLDINGAKLIIYTGFANPQIDENEKDENGKLIFELQNIKPFLDESFEIEFAEMHTPEMKSLEYPKALINRIKK